MSIIFFPVFVMVSKKVKRVGKEICLIIVVWFYGKLNSILPAINVSTVQSGYQQAMMHLILMLNAYLLVFMVMEKTHNQCSGSSINDPSRNSTSYNKSIPTHLIQLHSKCIKLSGFVSKFQEKNVNFVDILARIQIRNTIYFW